MDLDEPLSSEVAFAGRMQRLLERSLGVSMRVPESMGSPRFSFVYIHTGLLFSLSFRFRCYRKIFL